MNEWQQRVIEEHADLKGKIERLTKCGYEAILNERIGAFM